MPDRSISVHKRLDSLNTTLTGTVIEQVHHPLIEHSDVQLWVKREDQLHPIISGNKWRKLKYNIKHAIELGYDHLISMGGPWSNHLHALAFTGKELGLKTTGIIRGEQPTAESVTLQEMRDWGMQLDFVSRAAFREFRNDRDFTSYPADRYKGYWIPEGGANGLALKGIAEMVHEIKLPFDTIAVACGTGTTLAGIISALPPASTALGIAALKGEEFLKKDVNRLLSHTNRADGLADWTIHHDYHFGGFAKTGPRLMEFIRNFEYATDIPLEPIYTGKMMFGLFDLIRRDCFPSGHRIIAIHSGGLQGKRGFSS